MEKCLICRANDAEATGSHIVPHFLIKRVDNEEGQKGRDKEFGFVINEDESRFYFGRAVLPEKIEEVYGEVDEKLLKENNIDGIVDNLFCNDCEKKLSVFENEYSKTLKLSSEPNSIYVSTKFSFLGFIFWTSIVWRLSIMQGSGFKLKDKDERRLGRILRKYLKLELKEVSLESNDIDLMDVGYKILRAVEYSDVYPTLQFAHPEFERPYSIMIDEYMVFFYFKKNYMKGLVLDFFGSHQFVKTSTFNDAFNCEEILSMGHQNYEEIKQKMLTFLAKRKLAKLDKNLNLMHQRMFPNEGKEMDLKLKHTILKKISESEEKLGKQNLENNVRIIIELVADFYNIKH